MYDRKDLYGNRDPPAASRAEAHALAAGAELAALPEPFRSFYTRRAARELLRAAGLGSGLSEGLGTGHVEGYDQPLGGAIALRGCAGVAMPRMGFGTWKLSKAEARAATAAALDAGFRHIDTAPSYGNEPEVRPNPKHSSKP